jgi:hypothetical protein
MSIVYHFYRETSIYYLWISLNRKGIALKQDFKSNPKIQDSEVIEIAYD